MSTYNIVVTGGCGFIGSNLVDKLILHGYNVTIIDDLSTGKISNINPKATFIKDTITNRLVLDKTFKDIDYVFHLAAKARVNESLELPAEYLYTNLIGLTNVLESARINKIKRVIFASSSSVVGNTDIYPTPELELCKPLNPYALSKLSGEQLCKIYTEIYELETVSLRLFNVYGRRQDPTGQYALVICKFLDQWSKNQPLTITGNGTQSRDFVHIDDVTDAMILAMLADKIISGKVINIGSGKDVSIYSIAKLISNNYKYIPARLGEMKRTLADISLAKNLLKWNPKVSLLNGIEDLMQTYAKNR